MSQEDHIGGHSFTKKQHCAHLLDALQSPIRKAVRFPPD